MRKPGTDDDHAQMSDFLCDFCGSTWTDDLPMVEGHQGSLICARCLAVAYRQVILANDNSAPEGYSCALCLLTKPEHAWLSPATGAVACRWCVNKSADMLEKDPDMGWAKPRQP
ncbi:MAG: hypothetical protein HRU70_10110 [Phycisphaeraceae bacterium]|nr:MAG: hypothetical protein HRU70_10110 [Phycisphaeraceae bacterium]